MTCHACDDRGILPVDYTDEPKHFALCLCPVGEKWRNTRNKDKTVNPAWHVWAATNGIPHERVVKLEDYATPTELAAFGFRELGAADSLSAIAAAAKSRQKVTR